MSTENTFAVGVRSSSDTGEEFVQGLPHFLFLGMTLRDDGIRIRDPRRLFFRGRWRVDRGPAPGLRDGRAALPQKKSAGHLRKNVKKRAAGFEHAHLQVKSA